MIPTIARNLRHRNGSFLVACRGGFELVEDPLRAGRWTDENAAALLPMLRTFYVNPDHLSIVPAPSCGCCGEYHPGVIAWDALEWEAAEDGGWRCERHKRRLPCIVVGCGRTFKMDPGDVYATNVCCGRHWRMAPRYMRDRVRWIRRLAVRRQWPDRLTRLHSIAWHRAIRAIERRGDLGGEGHIDLAEIEAMFGV